MTNGRHLLWMRMLGITVGLVLLVGILIGAGTVYTVYQDSIAHFTQEGKNLARIGSDQTEMQVQDAISSLQDISQDSYFEAVPTGEYQSVLKDLVKQSQLFDGMSFLSADGKLLAVYPDNNHLIGTDLSKRNYFQAAITTGDPYVSDAYQAMTGRNVVALAVCVKNSQGQIKGVLVGSINLNGQNSVGRIFTKLNYGLEGHVLVVDRRGKIIFHPNPQKILEDGRLSEAVSRVRAGQTGVITEQRNGQSWLAAYQPIKNTGWGVVAEVPLEEAAMAARSTVIWIIELIALVIALAILVTFLLIKRVYEPIRRLHKVVHQVAAGDLSVRAELSGSDEISQFARSFNWMLEEVEKYIAEERKAEENLRQAEKLAACGQLAAGTAHEIRNPLTVIKGYAQILNQKLAGNENQEYIIMMLEEIKRIEEIVQDFLLLAKPPQHLEDIDFNDLLPKFWQLVKVDCQTVQVKFHLADGLPCIRGDVQQLKQVLLNLVNNALQAMKNKGELIFSTFFDGFQVGVKITDSGMGISPENIEKIGHPFFTTKESGTGLGLMVSYRIIQQHGGFVRVESKLGEGTTFILFFPVGSKV